MATSKWEPYYRAASFFAEALFFDVLLVVLLLVTGIWTQLLTSTPLSPIIWAAVIGSPVLTFFLGRRWIRLKRAM